jgi:hypothetical protein
MDPARPEFFAEKKASSTVQRALACPHKRIRLNSVLFAQPEEVVAGRAHRQVWRIDDSPFAIA